MEAYDTFYASMRYLFLIDSYFRGCGSIRGLDAYNASSG